MEGKGGRRQRRAGRDMGAAARRGRAGRLLGQARLAAGFLYGSAAPRIRARHCRAKIGGAAGPAASTVSRSGRRHVSPLPRHHAGNRRDQKC